MSVRLGELASVVRSKNAGPFELTFDIFFDAKAKYDTVKAAGVITRESIGLLYALAPEAILTLAFVDSVNGIKITIPRPRPQGGVGETDMHGAQQHVPLMNIVVPGVPA
jgi:hypothetical protein